jgi:CDP-glucose 4,6-dehydratase
MTARVDAEFWRGRRVLLTGHTGFKGAWTALWLTAMGAEVTGIALAADTDPSLFRLLDPFPGLASHLVDIRDASALAAIVERAAPEIVIHMAAQALVLRSYRAPVETFAINVGGTVNLLEALRRTSALRAILIVTSDKVYANREDGRAHGEGDPLGGDDPYSASKAAAEIAVASWRHSYFEPQSVALATARAGNVIGGGDWGESRLVPDAWRAARAGRVLALRHPEATRPWQHVLDCISGYLVYLQALAGHGSPPPALNFGPISDRELSVGAIALGILGALDTGSGWAQDPTPSPPEKRVLRLDPQRARSVLGWQTRLDLEATLGWTADWYRAFDRGADMRAFSAAQIAAYEALDPS